MVEVDHVIYAVRDLDDATRWFTDTFGLPVVGGGRHVGLGTKNVILAVGNGQYVELMAIEDAAVEHPLPRVLSSWLIDGDGPVAVCLRPDDFDGVARRLVLQPVNGERIAADGTRLHWRMAGLEAALGPQRLPFFIDWLGRRANPELEDTPDSAGDGFAWVEIGGDVRTLSDWLGTTPSWLRAAGDYAGPHRFALQRAGETVVVGRRA